MLRCSHSGCTMHATASSLSARAPRFTCSCKHECLFFWWQQYIVVVGSSSTMWWWQQYIAVVAAIHCGRGSSACDTATACMYSEESHQALHNAAAPPVAHQQQLPSTSAARTHQAKPNQATSRPLSDTLHRSETHVLWCSCPICQQCTLQHDGARFGNVAYHCNMSSHVAAALGLHVPNPALKTAQKLV